MVPESLPPYRYISSTPISTADASNLLNTYLTNSESHPHLHPDALITPGGVTLSAHGGPLGGVVLHNLRRVAAGLRGEYLEPEKTPEPEEQEEQNGDGKWKKGKRRNIETAEAQAVDANGGQTAYAADEGWQNLSEYEREQGQVEVGEVGDRNHFVASGGDAPEVQTTGSVEEDAGEEVGQKRKSKEDKEARKKAKKARDKQFKKEKAQKVGDDEASGEPHDEPKKEKGTKEKESKKSRKQAKAE